MTESQRTISVESAVRNFVTVLIGILIAIMGWVLGWAVNSIIDQGKAIATIQETVRHHETMRGEIRGDIGELSKKIDKLLNGNSRAAPK